jgi:hypothetical protein
MDWELILALEESGFTFAYAPVLVGAFRVHQHQATARNLATGRGWRSPSVAAQGVENEYAVVQRRFGLSGQRLSRTVGRAQHIRLKTLDGGYTRQWHARKLRGTSMRWFADAVGRAAVGQLADLYQA